MTGAEQPSVSVVVACTRPGRVAGIAAALAAGPRVPVELVVVGDVGELPPAGWPVPTVLVPCDEPHPNVRRNRGLDRAHAPVVALLDDDAVPGPGWLAEAARCPVDGDEVWTGPERPTRTSSDAQLAAAVAGSVLAEGSRAHIEPRDRPVRWYEVPFCNAVVPRRLVDRVGRPAEDIPWDMDDFHWCRQAAAAGATFRSRAALAIAHDRYPDRFTDWLAAKAADRRRTGEKLVRYPGLYARVPGVAVAAAGPWVVLGAFAVAGRARWRLAAAAKLAYVAVVAVEARGGGRRGADAWRTAGGLVALHAVSVASMQAGIADGLARRLLRTRRS